MQFIENEPPQDKTNKIACAPSKDSDQPRHPPSLIRVFAVRMKKAWVLSYPWVHSKDSDQTGWMPRLIWVFAGHTVILLVLSWGGSNIYISEDCKTITFFFENSEIPWLFSFLPYIPDWNQNSQTFPLGKKKKNNKKINVLFPETSEYFLGSVRLTLKKNLFSITWPTQKKCPLPPKNYWPSRRRFFLFPVLRFSFCISSKFPFEKASVYTLNVPL